MRNVVLVTFDSLRADHCSYAGYDRETTPALDEMADDGLCFENAISPGPSTPESMPVVLTGEFPAETVDDTGSLLAERRERIGHHMGARETLAERFSRAGYATAAFSPNPYTSRYFGFDAGFDRFEDFMSGSRAELYQKMLDGIFEGTSLGSVLPFRIMLNWLQREEVFKPWEDFYDAIVEWTESVSEPYFLWILLMDTHDPYLVPSEYRTQSRRAMYHANYRLWRQGHEPPFSDKTHERLVRAYDDSIRYADDFLARLRRDLGDDDPLIAAHGDHGEAFGEHGTYGHHQRLYEENVHVPFVVDGVAESRNVTTPVGLQRTPDLLTTLALADDAPAVESPAVPCQTLDEDRTAVRGRSWKYLREEADRRLLDLDAGEDEQLDDDELATLARRVGDDWEESLREQGRVTTAAADLEVSRL